MLFPRGGIDFCPHDCGADSLRTGTISADLSKLGREGRGRAGATMLDRRVKVSRRYVRGIIVWLAVTLASQSRIDAIFGRATLLRSPAIAED